VFNTFFKIIFGNARQFLILSAETTQLDSWFHLENGDTAALLITPRTVRDNHIADTRTRIYWALFDLVGFFLSDHLTTRNEDRFANADWHGCGNSSGCALRVRRADTFGNSEDP